MNQYKLNKELNCYEIEIHDKFFNHIGTALIDIEDYDKVKDWNWTLDREGFIVGKTRGGGKQIRLCRLVLDLGKSRVRVKYKTDNKFDNRKENLDPGDIKKKEEESGYTGVDGVKKSNCGTYEVYITYQQKRLYLGSSKDLCTAIGMRKRAEYQLKLDKGEEPISNPLQYIPQENYILDFNRRTNSTLNEYRWNYKLGCYEMSLYNRQNQVVATTLIDKQDYEKIKNYKWGLNDGYVATKMNGREMKLHRFIMNPPEDKVVDHGNWNTLDNRRDNLEIREQRENTINSGLQSNNKSGCTGVFEERGMWHAVIYVKKKKIDLGFYDNFDDARLARKQAEYVYGYAQIKGSPLLYIPDDMYNK